MKHEDVEFHAERKDSEDTEIFSTWDEAFAYMEGYAGTIDVVVWSEEGAEAFGGSDAVDTYNEDPDASVFERWTRKNPDQDFDCEGRVP